MIAQYQKSFYMLNWEKLCQKQPKNFPKSKEWEKQ